MTSINRFFAAMLIAVFLIAVFSTATVYAKGGYEPDEPVFVKGGVMDAEYTIPPIIPIIEEAPELQPPQQQPLTPPGTGTVIDNVTNENGIEFFTITSANGNIFFLIIDRQREAENVYFLNAVTERDLLALAEESGEDWVNISTSPPIIPNVPDNTELESETEQEPVPDPEPENGGGMGTIIMLIILILGGGAAGYYFKIYRPKQEANHMDDDFDFEDDYADDYTVEADPGNADDDLPPWDVEEADIHRDDE